MVCPNKRLKAWKDLVSAVGEDMSYILWDQHQGNVPQEYYKSENIKESATSVADSNISSTNISEPTVNFNDFLDDNAESMFEDNVENIFSQVDDSNFGKNTEILFGGNTGNLNVNNILSNIMNNVPDITEHTAELIYRAERLLGKSKVKVELVPENEIVGKKTVMQYDSDRNVIQISLDTINNFDSKTGTVAFLHEVVHSLTVQALMKDPSKRTFAEQELADVVNNFLEKYKDSSLAKDYGFTDQFEFVAEFYSNPEFRDAVKELSDNWWKKIMDAIRRMFDVAKNPEYTKLFDTIINFVEGDYQDFEGIKHYDRVFAKEAEFKKPELDTIEKRLTNLVNKAKDNISQVRARTSSSRSKNKSARREHLKNITNLLTEMENVDEAEKWKVLVQYSKAMAKTVYSLTKKTDSLLSKSKNVRKDSLLPSINAFEDYLAAYDLKSEIDDILSDAKINQSKLKPEELMAVAEISKIMNELAGSHDSLLSLFKKIKKEQAITIFARPENNTQIETDHRIRLTKEYNEVKPPNESKFEYISRMLSTRDKEMYENDLMKAAEKIVNDPAFDISNFERISGNPLNTKSKLIQIITNISNAVRDRITSQYKDYELMLGKFHEQYIKEKGNKPPSELYKNLYEQDKDGNYFFKGKYSIKFRDIYIEEFVPLEQELLNLEAQFREDGLTKLEIKQKQEVKDAKKKINDWLKEHTEKDQTDTLGQDWVPKKKYLNEELTGIDKDLLKEAISLIKDSHKQTGGKRSLIRRTGQVQFFKFPSITKSEFERTIEKDFKGILKEKKDFFTKVRPDEIGYSEAVSNKGESLKSIKIHFRGRIDPNQQSLDVFTILRTEKLNALNYREKSKEETTMLLLADISKTKDYYQISKKTGKPLLNAFNKYDQTETIKGEFSQEYSRIKGIIERNLYDTFHTSSIGIAGVDLSKVSDFVNGMTASIAMSANLASGTANLTNGFTQLFIEAFGGDVFSTKSLLKAEKKYTQDIPHILGDLANPVKKSFTNQLLEMYDVFGGFDPSTQDFIRNTIAKKIASRKTMNGLNEMGEHAMNAVVTMAVLDSLKVMNSNHKHIDKDGNVVSEEKAVSLLDMLKMNKDGKLVMDDKVKYTKHNLTLEYNQGGKVHINLLIKNKVFDLFGVYDINFKNELSKHWLGKSVMMFKNYFLSAADYRFTGFTTSLKNKEDLTEDELSYSSAKKDYIEGTYVSLIRYFKQGVIPSLKSLQLMHMKGVYNNLSEHEKANLKKATLEIMLTSVLLPCIGALLAAGAGPDDDEIWFLAYQTRRLESELSQFRNPIEATKIITNPVAGIKLIQNGLSFIYEVATPLDFVPSDKQNFFSYLNEDAKHNNILLKKGKKLIPMVSQLDRNYKQFYSLIDK
jgi:hypothetical protein